MVSMVTSTASSAVNSASTRFAKIEALNKQAGTLKQQLEQAQKADAKTPSIPDANSIAHEIDSIQAKIERLILENQLSKLTGANEPAHASEGSGTNPSSLPKASASSKARHGAAHGAHSPDPYAVAKASGEQLDVQA